MKFSEELVKKCIEVFKEENALDITPEQAQEYLKNLGGLYLTFSKKK